MAWMMVMAWRTVMVPVTATTPRMVPGTGLVVVWVRRSSGS
jgi:hypothetical protein